MKLSLFFLAIFSFHSAFSSSELEIKEMQWGDLSVYYIPNPRLPIYNISLYFADGSLSDGQQGGLTQAAFSFLSLGTRRYTKKQIQDNLDYFGTKRDVEIFPEYSVLKFSGLVKDIVPTTKLICHLFKDANYPFQELKKEMRRVITNKKNLITEHSELANIAFREISLVGGDLARPVEGKIDDLKKITSQHLKDKLNYFNQKVKKRIYITGPPQSLTVQNLFEKDCGWNLKAEIKREVKVEVNALQKQMQSNPQIYLVSVPKANQAQVRLGRIMFEKEFRGLTDLELTSTFLGGGFTSRLMRELRVKRGLTYSVSAILSRQDRYGRIAIMTSTQSQSLPTVLEVTKKTIEDSIQKEIPREELAKVKSYVLGKHLFGLESSEAVLREIILLHHLGLDQKYLNQFESHISDFGQNDLQASLKSYFDWGQLFIVVVGEKNLLPVLQKWGQVKVVRAQDYL